MAISLSTGSSAIPEGEKHMRKRLKGHGDMGLPSISPKGGRPNRGLSFRLSCWIWWRGTASCVLFPSWPHALFWQFPPSYMMEDRRRQHQAIKWGAPAVRGWEGVGRQVVGPWEANGKIHHFTSGTTPIRRACNTHVWARITDSQ